MLLRSITRRGRAAHNIAWGRARIVCLRAGGVQEGESRGCVLRSVGQHVSVSTRMYRRQLTRPSGYISACGRRRGLKVRTVRRINRILPLVRRAAFGRSCENIGTLRVSIPRRSCHDDVIAGGCARYIQIIEDRCGDIENRGIIEYG